MRTKKTNRGFTLLELMIVLVIIAISVTLALPSYEEVLQRRDTTGKAESLAAFLASAQSQAVKSNMEVSVQLAWTSANNWCVGIDESSTGCDCMGIDTSNLCTVEGVTKTLGSETQTRSSMLQPPTGYDYVMTFDPIRGTMITSDLGNDHNFTLQSDNSKYELQVQVGPTGRIRVCNSTSSKAVAGFEAC